MNTARLKGEFSLLAPSLVAAILTCATPLFPQSPDPQGPCINQSPRTVNFDQTRTSPPAQGLDYDFVSRTPLVAIPLSPPTDTITYQRLELHLCDRHYHVPVENVQGCPNEKKDLRGADKKANELGPLPPGQWIEVHTVYAAEVSKDEKCKEGYDHGLKCCTAPPFVVLGYSAQIGDSDHLPGPGDVTEWVGSATSEVASRCNPVPAQWRFALGCKTTLTPEYVERSIGGEAHSARRLQTPNNLSSDLAFVPAQGSSPSDVTAKTCRLIQTSSIVNTAAADRICPGVCQSPLGKAYRLPDGHVDWKKNAQGAVCICCPLDRPQ